MLASSVQRLEESFSKAVTSETVAALASPSMSASVTETEPQADFSRFYREYERVTRKEQAAAVRASYPQQQRDRSKDGATIDDQRDWQTAVQHQLMKHIQLPKGWDGYGSPAPTADTAAFTLIVLNDIMQLRSPIPQVVPSSGGGIQLEWHEKDIDLELHISAPYACEMWFQDHRQADKPAISLELSTNFSPLNDPMKLLASR